MAELQLFQHIAANHLTGNPFALNYNVQTSCNIGECIPILCDECVPGDYFRIGLELGIRLQPLNAPINDNLIAQVDYFFVPYRLLWKDWVKFITGGTNGDFIANIPVMPWSIDDLSEIDDTPPVYGTANKVAVSKTLWDYFGFPLATDLDWYSSGDIPNIKARPLAFPWVAANMIKWYYYTDQNLNPEYMDNQEWDDLPASYKYSNEIWSRPYRKDYFTSALPFQQRGTAPALPLSGYLPVVANDAQSASDFNVYFGFSDAGGDAKRAYLAPSEPSSTAGIPYSGSIVTGAPGDNFMYAAADGASSFTVPEMRQVFAIQKWMELNARGGARYNEFLYSHFAVSPTDKTLQRPEYLGRLSTPILVSEVLQMSSTASGGALGDVAGRGITFSREMLDNYKVEEFGIVLGFLSIMPPQSYFQGINRQWLRRSRFDFYFPEFANLSEQGIYNAELYVQNDSVDADDDFLDTVNGQVFGFQGIYDEMRIKQNKITGMMRDTLDYWHAARKFANPPNLNEDFITVKSSDFDRLFAVQDEDQIIVYVKNILDNTIRPMPSVPEPGLIDHVF